jgi:hypothetical protein
MPPSSVALKLRLPFVSFLLLLALQPATADDEVWARIHLADRDARTAEIRDGNDLADYGSFLFGPIDGAKATALRDQGYRIQVSENPFLLSLGGETFDPTTRPTLALDREVSAEGDLHLIQFKGPIRPEWLQRLRRTGLEIVQPLHPFSYFVWASEAQLQDALGDPAIRWSGPMESAWKLQAPQALASSRPAPAMVMISAHGDVRDRINSLRRFGSIKQVRNETRHFILLEFDQLPASHFFDLARLPGVYTVQAITEDAGPRGEMSNQSIVGNIDGAGNVLPGYVDWLSDTGYDGSGVIVGVVDGYVRISHDDLADRMVPCSGPNNSCTTSGASAHGTHVAGAIAGTGATGAVLNLGTTEDPIEFLRGQGVAPGASLVTQRYQPFIGAGSGGMVPDGMLDIYLDSARSGALLTNNSWGPSTTPQGYNIPTRQIDVISRDADPDTPGDQPVLAVWSIMNGNGDSSGACAPSSLGAPDEAKNLFAVGSTSLQSGSNGAQLSNIFRISSNSAHGNACDGRRVPHIVAPGCSTDSTTSSSDTAHSFSFCGTSMASPVVSGAVAIFMERYIAEHGVPPSPALVKAIFTAAAQDLEGNPNADGGTMGHRPDRFQGYGRIDLDAVMNHGLEVYTRDQETVFTSTGDSWSVGLNADDPSQPIRIMLAWTDAPGGGLGGSTPAWVNDLDLSVTANGSTYLGNVIGPDGWSASGGSADDRNNLEGVFLNPAQHGGAINITVDATDIAGDALNPWTPGDPSQDFALVCYNCFFGDPTYRLSLDDGPLEACIPESGTTDAAVIVNVGTRGPYSGTVGLSTSGEPAGLTSSIDPASVSAPATSTWTLTVADTAASGSGTISLLGDDGSNQNSIDLAYRLDALLASGPVLTTPADGAVDQTLQPTFQWEAIAGVDDYRLQIATDAAFSSLVVDAAPASSGFVPAAELATGTEYFWRVAGGNLCGAGAWSSTRSFTTRLEPVAGFSASQFDLSVATDSFDSTPLEISNLGTGSLSWSVATDQLDGAAGRAAIDPVYDEPLSVPDFTVTGDASGGNTEAFTIPGGVLTRGTVLGFGFEGTVSGITGNSDWASDLRLVITSPEGASFDVGGFSGTANSWDFQGAGSSDNGTYSSTHPAAFGTGTVDDGDWTLSFRHGWVDDGAGSMAWTDVTVTLLKAPPPFCMDSFSAVPWLSVNPESGSVPSGESEMVSVDIDTTGMVPGIYTGYLCVSSNDPNAAMTPMPIELTVTENSQFIFRDRFEN